MRKNWHALALSILFLILLLKPTRAISSKEFGDVEMYADKKAILPEQRLRELLKQFGLKHLLSYLDGKYICTYIRMYWFNYSCVYMYIYILT